MFRAAVRLVFEYMDWITGEAASDDIGDDVAANVKIAQRKKSHETKGLTIEVYMILLYSRIFFILFYFIFVSYILKHRLFFYIKILYMYLQEPVKLIIFGNVFKCDTVFKNLTYIRNVLLLR